MLYYPKSTPPVLPSTPVSAQSSYPRHLHLQPEDWRSKPRGAPVTRTDDVLCKDLKHLGTTLAEASTIAIDRTRWGPTIVASAVSTPNRLSEWVSFDSESRFSSWARPCRRQESKLRCEELYKTYLRQPLGCFVYARLPEVSHSPTDIPSPMWSSVWGCLLAHNFHRWLRQDIQMSRWSHGRCHRWIRPGDSSMNMSKFEYADDAALVDDDAATATTRVTAFAAGSLNDAAMVITEKKRKAMHPTTRVSATKEAEVVALKLKHVCDSCSRTLRGLSIYVSFWCDGGLTQRSCRQSRHSSEGGQETVCGGSAKPGSRWQHCSRERALFRVFGGKTPMRWFRRSLCP